MSGAGLTERPFRQVPSDMLTLKPYWGKPAVRDFRGDDGNVGIIRSPVRAIVLLDRGAVTILKDGKILDAIHVEGRPHGMDVDPTTFDVYTSSSVAQSPNVTKSSRKKAASN